MPSRFALSFTLIMSTGLTPSSADLSSFEHHPEVELKLFASEPMVVDPVAMCFSANGDAYVVEMRDYPYGFGPDRQPGGTLRLLRDTSGDGTADEAHLFAENLSFPTSVTPWRKGVLVAAPPQILYLEDTDGDDKADRRDVLFDGFKLGVTDSNMNSLRFGLDGRIHGANGGAGGRVTSPLLPEKEPINLRGHDFSFSPDRVQTFDLTHQTGGGFGLVFDEFGHSFTTYNIDYLQQRIIAKADLDRNPSLPRIEATRSISVHGESARIYPIAEAQTRVNHPEQAGYFSSAGGMGLLESGPLADVLGKSIFVCDVVGNLVHRDSLSEEGPIFQAERFPEEQDKEFLASRDPLFRPIGLEHGPDGALYLIDMQREVIEHPDYIPAKVLEKLNVRGGEDRGRIYRIIPRQGALLTERRDFEKLSFSQLVSELGSDHRWRADTAHRLLRERMGSPTPTQLREIGRVAFDDSSPARARVRALWLLVSHGGVGAPEIMKALGDPHPGVRENALSLADRFVAPPPPDDSFTQPEQGATNREPLEVVLGLVSQDPNPRVRSQAALTLGHSNSPEKLAAFKSAVLRDATNFWSRTAVWTAIKGQAKPLLESLLADPAFFEDRLTEARTSVIEELSLLAAKETLSEGQEDTFFGWLATLPFSEWSAPDQNALLTGLAQHWSDTQPVSHPDWLASLANWTDASHDGDRLLIRLHRLTAQPLPPSLQNAWQDAVRLASDAARSPDERREAMALLAEVDDAEARSALIGFLESTTPAFLQKAAMEALAKNAPEGLEAQVLAKWKGISPSFRPQLIQFLLRRTTGRVALLDALDAKQVTVQELNLDLEQRRTLLRWSSKEIAERAKAYVDDHEYSNRKAIVEEWLGKLPEEGNLEEGHQVFTLHCALCHRVRQDGHAVGPDLTGVGHRSVEDLLSHILDPNMAINPNYTTCVIETNEGTVHTGLLAQETADELVLLLQLGIEQRIPRSTIKRREILSTSLMPAGIEASINPQQMRSLIAFLQES